MIRKAEEKDITAVVHIYNKIHEQEQKHEVTIGWNKDIYPVKSTATDALERGDLFVYEEKGIVLASAIINKRQIKEYADGAWNIPATEDKVMVLHTLTVDPDAGGKGIGKKMISFYEDYAAKNGCLVLRIDTNAKNVRARKMYAGLGYVEVGIVPCVFNGIEGVQLVLLEKGI